MDIRTSSSRKSTYSRWNSLTSCSLSMFPPAFYSSTSCTADGAQNSLQNCAHAQIIDHVLLPPRDPGKSSNAHWHGGEADDGRRWHRELCQAGQGILVGWRWSTGVGLWRYGIAKTYCVVSNPRVGMTPKQNGFCWIMFFFYFSLSKLLTRYALSIMWWGRWWELSLLIHVRTVYLVCRYCSCQRRQLCL